VEDEGDYYAGCENDPYIACFPANPTQTFHVWNHRGEVGYGSTLKEAIADEQKKFDLTKTAV
jgi:hypothetical protein